MKYDHCIVQIAQKEKVKCGNIQFNSHVVDPIRVYIAVGTSQLHVWYIIEVCMGTVSGNTCSMAETNLLTILLFFLYSLFFPSVCSEEINMMILAWQIILLVN